MTPEQFARIEGLFAELIELSPEERASFLEQRCSDDQEVRQALLELLEQDQQVANPLDGPSPGEALRSPVSEGEGFYSSSFESGALPERIGPFEVLARLGSGGMGTVYLVQQASPLRKVALKVLRPELSSAMLRRRFQLEAKFLARLKHPCIAQIYESGMLGGPEGQPFIAMEYVEGSPLLEYARRLQLDRTARLKLMVRICEAIEYAHARGVLHRDLKPENVLVMAPALPGGEPMPKVLDFGIGRALDQDATLATLQTMQGEILGTLAYMSPEQASAGEVDQRTDVYALGVILYQLLSGRLPHDLSGRSLPDALNEIQAGDTTRLGELDSALRGDLDTICARALESEPKRRYASAGELARDIEHYLQHEPITARPPTATYRLLKFARRNRVLVGGLLSTMLVLVVGIVVATGFALRSARNARLAEANEARALREIYRASIESIQRMSATDPMRSAALLADAPARYRDWEWSYLAAQLDAGLLVHSAPDLENPYHSDVAFIPSGELLLARGAGSNRNRVELVSAIDSKHRAAIELEGELVELQLNQDGSRLGVLTRSPPGLELHSVSMEPGGLTSKRLFQRTTNRDMTRLLVSPQGKFVGAWNAPSDPPSRRICEVYEVGSGDQVWSLEDPYLGLSLSDASDGPRLGGWTSTFMDGAKITGRFMLQGPKKVFAVSDKAPRTRLESTFSNAGDRLLVTRTREDLWGGEIYDSGTMETLTKLGGLRGVIFSSTFSTQDRLLALCGVTGGLFLADGDSGAMLRTYPDRIWGLNFNPTDSRLAACSAEGVKVWDLSMQPSRLLAEHNAYVYQAVYSPDGSLLATAGADPEVRLWDPQSGEALLSLPFPRGGHVKGLSFSEDGLRLVAIRGDRQERITAAWKLAEGASAATELPPYTDSPASDPEWAGLSFWNRSRSGSSFSLQSSRNSLVSRVNNDGQRTLFGATDRGFVAHGGDAPEVDEPYTMAESALAVSPDGELVAGVQGLDIILWERRTKRRLGALTGSRGAILGLAFNPSGTRLASSGRDQVIRIWDMDSQVELLQLTGHKNYVHGLSFSPDGMQLVSTSGDSSVRLWDTRKPDERAQRIAAASALREQLRPMLKGLLLELGDPTRVMEQLQGDERYSTEELSACLRLLLTGEML